MIVTPTLSYLDAFLYRNNTKLSIHAKYVKTLLLFKTYQV